MYFSPMQIVHILSLHQLESPRKLNSKIPNVAVKFLGKKLSLLFLLVFSVIFFN